MATTYHFYLRKDKKRASGECPIYLRITQNRKSRYVSSGVYVNPKDWNEEKEEVRKTHSNFKSLNSILRREQGKAEKIQDELGAHGKDSAKAIQQRIKNQRSSDFFDLAEDYRKDLEDRKRLYAIKNLGVMLNKLEAFEGERSLSIKDIDNSYLERFEGFLKRKYNNRSTTINKNFEPVKEIVRKALNEHLITENPFHGFNGAKRGRPEPKVKLTIEQINAIQDFDLEEGSNLWHTRNYFMFSFYSAGIRFGDMCCLKWSDIKGDRLSYQMNKNEKVFTVELNEHQNAILDLLQGENNDWFIFPILNEYQDHSDPILLRKQIGSKNALINKWLKRVCDLVNDKIKEKELKIAKLEGVSFHVARHSFAQYAVGKGLSIYEVMQTLRHSKIETTQKYLKGLDEELADKAMKKYFNMSEKIQFTFEDWETGKIYNALKDKSIGGFDFGIVKDVGWFPTDLYENGFMNVEEFKKITKTQKESFFKAVKNNVAFKLRGIKRQLESAYKPKEYLEETIKSLEDGIETFPKDYLRKVYAGEWSRLMIGYSIPQRLNDSRLKFGSYEILFTNAINVPNRLEKQKRIELDKSSVPTSDNNLLNLTVALHLTDKLKALYKELYQDDSVSEVKTLLTRSEILRRAHALKVNGMKVNDVFKDISDWLLIENKLSKEEVKKQFGFSLSNPDSFNRFVNDNPLHAYKE